MAETSSAAFDCAAKNWNSKQTATSSTLTELLSDFTSSSSTTTKQTTTSKSSSSSLSNKKNHSIKNGNGVDDQFVALNDDLLRNNNKTTIEKNNGLNKINNQKQLIKESSINESFNKVNLTTSSINQQQQQEEQNSNFSTQNNKEKNNNNNSINSINSVNESNDRLSTSFINNNNNNNQNELSKQSLRNDNIIFKVGFKLEACDSTGTWFPAKVVAINEEDKQVLIHFIRWSKKFDEWMSMQSDQLRALTKEDDENSETDSQKSFSIGKKVLASWSDNKKYPGTVKSVTTDGNYNIEFYDGYRKKVKRSLVEAMPDDYQFNSPIDNLATIDGKPIMLNMLNNNLAATSTTTTQSPQQQTNGSTSNLALLNATPITSSNSRSKKRITDHLIASKEFVIKEDHNQFKCEVENCNKSFRKEKLLNSHIKYYHPEVYESEEYKKRRLEPENTSNQLDDSLSNDLLSFNSSRKSTINENSNTSEITTPKSATITTTTTTTTAKSSSKKNNKIEQSAANSSTDKSTTTTKNNKLTNNNNDNNSDLVNNLDQHIKPTQSINGELDNSKINQQPTTPINQKSSKRNRTSSKQKQQQQQTDTTNDLSNKQNSSLNLSASSSFTTNNDSTIITPTTSQTTIQTPSSFNNNNNNSKSNRLSNQNDSISYASDSTIEDSISSFDSPLTINKTISSNKKTAKRGRAPGKRKIKEKIDPDYFEDSSTISTTKSFESKKKTTTNKDSSNSRRKRPKNNQKCLNKELLELKIEIQEKQQKGLLSADDERSNLFFTNTPSTSSASESALAECAEFGTDFYDYQERRYRDTSPTYSFDNCAQSPTNFSYINDSFNSSTDKKKKKVTTPISRKSSNASFNLSTTISSSTNKRQRLSYQSDNGRNISSPTFLNASSILPAGYSTTSRKLDRSIVLRDGFIFSANNDFNNSNVSPLSLHANIEKPIPNTILPFWDARYVREIHESDDVDELVHCICDFKEESGLMIQCEICLTWQHGTCFDIEVEEKVPESYVCFNCKDPKAVRESQRFIYDQEWLKKGKYPSFSFISEQQKQQRTNNNNKNQSTQSIDDLQQSAYSIKQTLATNQLLAILHDVAQILRSLRYKINLIINNNVKEMKYWESHLEDDLIPPPLPSSIENNDDLLNNEDELVKDKILDQNMTQTEHEMIGDILDFSKNILGNEQGDNKSNSDEDLNIVLDDATDLIDFISLTGKDDCDQKELTNSLKKEEEFDNNLNNNLDFNLPNSSTTNNINIDSSPFDHMLEQQTKSTSTNLIGTSAINSTSTNQSINQQLNDLPILNEEKPKKPTLEEKLLDHINNVHLNVMNRLEMAENKIIDIEKECGLDKSDLNSLKEEYIKIKDTVKDIYRDIENVNRFTMI